LVLSQKRLFGLRRSPQHVSVPRGTAMGQMMTEMVGMNIRGVLEGTWVKYEDQESNKGGTEEDRDEEKVPFAHRQKKLVTS